MTKGVSGVIRSIATACLEQGRSRNLNSDNVYAFGRLVNTGQRASLVRSAAQDDPLQLFAVADGLDGAEQGARAAETALALLGAFSERLPVQQDFFAWARTYLDQANRSIGQLLDQDPGLIGGTTLTAILLHDQSAYTLSVGNSRAYLYRDGSLTRLTRDDVTWTDDVRHLTRWLGMQDGEIRAEDGNLSRTGLQRDDVLLLTTDGITDLLSDEELAACLAAPDAFVQRIGRIRDRALHKGAPDDFSLIGIRIRDPDGKFAANRKIHRERSRRPGQADLLEQSQQDHRWMRPLGVFLLCVLLGLLLGKLLTSLPAWFWHLLPGG
ncbi:MAG: protein serine/threonine phosphatase 2C family protein [Clostridiaceae bacterium]|nr:protein serine/threonine phosphatase 2C family protein [Clostridiaceae bacterium]